MARANDWASKVMALINGGNPTAAIADNLALLAAPRLHRSP